MRLAKARRKIVSNSLPRPPMPSFAKSKSELKSDSFGPPDPPPAAPSATLESLKFGWPPPRSLKGIT